MSTAIYIGCGWDTSPFLWDDMMKTVKRIMIMKNNH